jgi:hypothetical protein
MNRNYKSLTHLDVSLADITRWADARETDVVVAVAIHAIADSSRSPEVIWEDPTPAETDHVTVAVEEYVTHGDYDRSDDGRYCWGQSYVTLVTTYTILDQNGERQYGGLTAYQAMAEILTDDGHDYEIRPEADGEGFRLWTSTYSRNSTAWSGLTESTIYSLQADEGAATQEIAEKIINAGWPRKPEAITDERYAEMMAELAAEQEG